MRCCVVLAVRCCSYFAETFGVHDMRDRTTGKRRMHVADHPHLHGQRSAHVLASMHPQDVYPGYTGGYMGWHQHQQPGMLILKTHCVPIYAKPGKTNVPTLFAYMQQALVAWLAAVCSRVR